MVVASRREWRRIALSLALMLPAAIPYATHFADHPQYSLPTGYIQADMPLYMAKAREAFDSGRMGFFYANPCDAFSDKPRIYFQPWTYLLGLIHFLTAIRPGVLWVGFWFLSAMLASRIFVAVFEAWVGLDSRAKKLALIAFFWGGGVLAPLGILRGLWLRGWVTWDDLTALDPFRGWWFLNLGRNLVYPTEALYHALAFAAFLTARSDRSVIASWALAGLTALCSPFAGLETLAILWMAGLVESFASRNRPRAVAHFCGINVLVAIFLIHHVWVLNRYPEHRALESAMMLDWRYSWVTCLAAYGPVFVLSAWRFQSRESAKAVLSNPSDRFLLSWAMAAFLLENHDWFVTPRQPIHFTRGYVWAALFLFGSPTLISILDRLSNPCLSPGSLLRRASKLALKTLLIVAIFADNATWFSVFVHEIRVPDRNGLRLSREKWEVLEKLNEDAFVGHLLVSEDQRIADLALAETRLRSIVGHPLETPDYRTRVEEVRRFFESGELSPSWRGQPLVVVVDRHQLKPLWPARGRAVFENRRFQILQFGKLR